MIIFFYGTDSYRLKELREKATVKHAQKTQLSAYDLSFKEDCERLEITLKTIGLFAAKEVLLARRPEAFSGGICQFCYAI